MIIISIHHRNDLFMILCKLQRHQKQSSDPLLKYHIVIKKYRVIALTYQISDLEKARSTCL